MANLSPFAIFGLEPRFRIDLEDLARRHQSAMRKVHPDLFAGRSAAERRVAEQWSTRINECYELLRNPVARGAWLCEAAGCSVEAETRTSMPADFLVEQLEKREALESVDDAESARCFLEMAEADFGRLTEETARAIDDRRDWPAAVDSVRRLMFAERLLTEARRRLAALAAQP